MIERRSRRKWRKVKPRRRPTEIPGDLSSSVDRNEHDITNPQRIERRLLQRKAAHKEDLPEPTHEQLSASRILFVLRLEEIIKERSEHHHGWHDLLDPREYREIDQTRSALTRLYILRTNDLSDEKFRKKYKEKVKRYDDMLTDMFPQIEPVRTGIYDSATFITDADREEIAQLVRRKYHQGNYRRALIGLQEPDPEIRAEERDRYWASGKQTIATTIIAYLFSGAVTAYETTHQHFQYGSLADWKTILPLLVSYGLNYLSLILNYRTQLKSLEDKDAGTSASVVTKLAHDVTTNLLPEDPRRTKKAVWRATAFPTVVWEPLLILGLLLPGTGLVAHGAAAAEAFVVGRNAAGTIFNAGEAGFTEMYRRRRGRNFRRRQQEKARRANEETNQ